MKNALPIALAVALALALVAIAYLLGQRSVAPATPAPIGLTPHPTAHNEDTITLEPTPRPPKAPARNLAADPIPSDPIAADEDVQLVRDGKGGVTIASPGEQGSAIADYLDQVHALQVGPAGADSNSFAQQLLGEAMQGDMSGFDDLVRQAKTAEQSARAIQPPAGAADHHAKLLSLLGESTKLLQSYRQALIEKNPDGMGSLMSSAKALQTKAHALEVSEKSLRRK